VLELFPSDFAADLERALAEGADAEGVRRAVHWDERSGIAWEVYAPPIEAALRAGLPMVAGDLSAEERTALRKGGLAGIGDALRARVERVILDAATRAAMAEGIREAHCGHAPEERIEAMIDAQRARDARLAQALFDAAARGGVAGAILIGGTEHARNDRGVPRYLVREVVTSLAFASVADEALDAHAHFEARWGEVPPFDFVWFTPRLDDEDPCEKYREALEKLP
jgi:uncharacterized iron-regulated protein